MWRNCQLLAIESIQDAARKLRAISKVWHHGDVQLHRRATLIGEELKRAVILPKWNFLDAALKDLGPGEKRGWGAFTLLEQNSMLVSMEPSCACPSGEIIFDEDKTSPPSRAYLKLWEVFTRLSFAPQKGDRCVDLGACPGGWTWVLAECGAEVLAFDRAPLAPALMKNSLVKFQKADAFAITAKDVGSVDWLFSDLIADADKLVALIHKWNTKDVRKGLVVTLKFKGETRFDLIENLQKIPGARVLHLWHNKHEVTCAILRSALS